MSNELTTRQNVSMMPVMDLALAVERQRQLISFVREIMVEGVDYGKVPGTEKDTLLKPGAEKLSTFFGLSPQFEDAGSVEKWDATEPLFFYRYKCKLYKNDTLIGEGIGSCNSRESKYRWRWVEEKDLPPHLDTSGLMSRSAVISEFEFAINKRETTGKYGKPLAYWQAFEAAIKAGEARSLNKKTGKGQEYPAWEIETKVYRVPNEDIFSQINTIDKMAQKRALVAAVLIGVNASEFFTQDMEDLVENFTIIESTAMPVATPEQPKPPTPPTPEPAPAEPKANGNGQDKPKKQPQWSQAGKKFFQAVEEATNNHWQGNGWHFQKSMEKLGLNWSFLNSEDETTNAWAVLTDYARQQQEQPEASSSQPDEEVAF